MFHERTTNLLFFAGYTFKWRDRNTCLSQLRIFPVFLRGCTSAGGEKERNKTRQEEPNIVMEGGGGGGCT